MKRGGSKKKTAPSPAATPDCGLEKSLRQGEESYHGLFNAIQQAIYIHDPDGRFVDVNDGACAMYGYTREEFIGRTPEFLAAPGINDFNYVMEQFRQAFAGEPCQLEFWGRRKDGEIFPKDLRLNKGTYFGRDVVIGVATDITGQKRAEKALFENMEYYQAIVTTSPDNITITDLSGTILMGSPASVAMFGLPDKDAANGKNLLEFIVPEEQERARKALASMATDGAALGEYHGRRMDGSIVPFEVHVSLMRNREGRPWRLVHVVRDISRRKHLEDVLSSALTRSHNQQQVISAVAASPLVSSGNLEELARLITEQAARVLEVERANIWIFDEAETRLTCIDLYEATSGTHTSGTILRESEFRQEFEALKSSKFINADDPLTDPRTAGYAESYLVPLGITSMLDAVVRSAGKNTGIICFEHVKKPHTWEPDEITFACQLADQIALTITNREKNQAQAALAGSEERYRRLLEAVTDYVFTVRIENGRPVETVHGTGCEAVTGYSTRDFSDDPGLWLRMVVEEDRPAVTRQAEALLAGEEVRAIEHRIVHKDGGVRWVINTPVPHADAAGNLLSYDGLIQDITGRKTVELAFARSEAQLHAILRASPIPKFVIDKNHRVISWNRALENTTGIEARAVLGTRLHWKAFYPEERPCLADLLVDNMSEKIQKLYTGKWKESDVVDGAYEATDFFPILGDGGKWLHFIAAPITDNDGGIIGAVETLQDITDLVNAQAELKESEERYSSLFSNNYSVSLIIDPDTAIIVDANDAAAQYYGYSRDQLLTMGIHNLNRLPRNHVVQNLMRAKDEKEKHFFSTHYRADGEKRNVEIYSGPIRIQGKSLFYSIIHDITETRQAARALQESEERYRTLIDQLPDYVIVHRNGLLLYVNKRAASSMGYDSRALVGKSISGFIAPEHLEKVRDAIGRRMAGEDIPPYEMRIAAQDGSYRSVLVNGAAISYEGRPASLNVLTDITLIKQAEEKIRSANEELEKRVTERTEALIRANEQLISEISARTHAEQEITRSLEEKDLLLREIHHRVKNNLQIIASLLKLQSRYITDPKVLDSIQESQSRVRAMALVHERIYRSHNIAEINLRDYLTYLTRQIFQFYNIQQHQIGISVTMDDIMADIDTITPLGLIMNELVSNSLKHAFPDGRKGAISIECTREEAGSLRFVYHDDGTGIPPDLAWKTTESLGLRLVNSLVDQLNGTIDLAPGEGTTFIIRIKKGPAEGNAA